MTTYRGFDITKTDAGYTIHSMGSHPPVAEVFPSEDAAMNHIDAYLKARRAASQA